MRLGSRATNTSSSGASKMMMTVKNTGPIAQFSADARLLGVFEQSAGSGKSFDYSKSVDSATESVPEEQITGYLSTIQRGGLIQSFGCMLAIEEPTFRIIAYSENSLELLGFQEQFESLLGIDVRSLFTPSSASSLAKAVIARDISLFNPICIHSKSTGKPFYAILHRIDVGIVVDLEPAKSGDPALSIAGAVQSQKLAVRAVSRLQLLPGGDVGVLCDTVAEIVKELTGYDRVMVYRFHEDEHGEVVSEVRRSDFEPYLGLHYPAIDIPQACRFLFKQNKVRMICDCHANPVRVIQDDELRKPLCLINSTLRSPHDCHTQYMASMDSIASLVMAVIISGNEEEGFSGRHTSKLWGLVACHHSSPRYVPFPLRYACEFLMQAFGLQLNMELQMATQLAEKKILRIQTFLCDMLLRDSPFGIVTQSPSIMDLVKCDGAALYYGAMCWLLGVTPTETQIKDIAEWLLTCHSDVTGLSTDSLADAGYPGAASLGDAICGMASARITSKDFLFWFRSHTAREIKWGGAKHYPKDKDDGGRMNPRASFIAFLEVVKSRSLPWENSEINAIHSLQLILRVSFQEIEDSNSKVRIRAQLNDAELRGRGKLSSVAGEMVKLTERASVPIFAIDSSGVINGWNAKVAELTGLPASEAMGKLLVRDLVHDKYQEVVDNHLCRALRGEEVNNLELKLKTFGSPKKNSAVFLVSNACSSKDHMNNVVGVSFVGQDITRENIVMDKFIRLQEDYTAVVQSLNPLIPPIFASDENAYCTEWNAAMEKLSGWSKGEINGKLLPGEIFGEFCHLKCQEDLTKFRILLYSVTSGQAIENFPFAFFDREGKYVEVLLTANKRTDVAGHVIGCFCFLQTSIPDLQQALEVKRHQERTCFVSLKELAYIRQEMKNPINGIRFNCKLLEDSGLSEDQKEILETSTACGRQMMKILEDMDLDSIENGYMELDMSEFLLGTVMDAIVSQVMILLRERGLQLIRHIPEEIKTMSLCGDQDRLQQVLADFWLNIVRHSPSPDGWVEIEVASSLRQIEDGIELVHLQFRMTHPGKGFPPDLVQDMFHRTSWDSPEGLGLSICRKLLEMMNGRVEYIREPTKCYFLINIELCTSRRDERNLK